MGEDTGMGIGLGAGKHGFHFGTHGVWYLLPDHENQPAVALLGGIYFNRVDVTNYLVLRFVPTVSKSYKVSWGKLTPYAGLQLSPSFGLGTVGSEFSVRSTMGTQILVAAFGGVTLWTELDLSLANSESSAALGISYPFTALGG